MSTQATPRISDAHLDSPAGILTLLGASSVVAGGVVAAVTGPLGLDKGSWLAAYLVLVSGVAQFAIGQAPKWLGARASGWSLVVSWNLGNAAVIVGTLAGLALLVDLGALLLVIGLGIAASAVRGARTHGGVLGWAYRALLLVLIVSIPIGVLLSHLRNA